MSLPTNDIKFNVKNGLAVGASGFEVINTAGEWVGASGPGQSPYGATGAQGTYGASGITGDAGTDGASGATGIEGTQGATGIEGYQGATGSQGTQGDTYRYYASGSTVSTSLAPGFYDGFSNGLHVDPEFEVGDKVKVIDQTSGSSLVYYGEIFDVQYAGGFGFNHRVIIESISGTPIGGTSNTWLIQASATQGASGADGYQGATGSQGSQGPDGAIKLQHTYEWTDDQLVWNGNAYAGGVSPSVSRLEFLQTDGVYDYLNALSPGTTLVIDWQASGLVNVATVTTIGTVQSPTAYTNGRHYLQISANPDGYAAGGYASTDSTDVLMIGDGPRNQGFRGAGGDQGVQGSTGVVGIDGASGVQGVTGQQGLDGATGGFGGYRAGTWAFDPTYTSNLVDLSNGNNTAVDNGAGFANALGTIQLDNTSGNYYYMFSILVDYASNNGSFIGIASRSANINDSNYYIGADTNSAGFKYNGEYWYDGGGQGGSLPTWGTGDVVDIAVDQDDSFIWIRVNGGDWNNDPTANPGNYTGGLSTYALSGPWYPAVSIYGVEGPTQLTIREYAQYTVPTGSANYTFLPASVKANQGYTGASGVTGEVGATGVHGARYHTTSNTTLSLTTGATGVVVVDDYLNYSVGQTILLADGGGKHIHATVDSYDAGTKILAFTPFDHVGTGSSSPWEINLDGAEGAQGASGATGIIGDQGLDGASGSQGSSFGTQGATGADGDAGIDGASGAQGHQGATGATGVRGTVGHDGATGILGDDGVQGATGSQGYQGDDGASGVQGIDGQQGYQGATGSIGTQGDDGDQGYTGVDGATGLTGATGAQGGDGSSAAVQFDTSYGHYGPHQSISSGSNGTNTILSGTVGYIEAAITTAEMSPYINSGLSMFGVTLNAGITSTTNRIGLGTSGIDVNNELGKYDNQSQGFQQDGAVYTNGTQTDALSISWGVGDLVEVAVNYNTGYFWARVNGGAWSKSGDPVAGTNGSPFLLAQPHSYPAVSTLDNAIFELITTPQYDVPSGYTYLSNTAATNIGYQGATGADGEQGPVGNAGFDADQLTTGNPRGLWDAGTQYYVGDIVVTIPLDSHRCLVDNIGYNPDSYPEYWAYTAWAGASGASGIDGSTGPAGIDGASGAQGIDGASGAAGIDGASGAAGIDGASGPAGIDGASGAAGIDGASGAAGIDGASGITGATGYSGLQFKATADGNFSVYAIGTPITIPFLADPDTGATTYNYSTGQSVIIAKDINNYMVADITNVLYGGNTIDVVVTKSVGTASGVSGWVVNLDGAVGWIGASGATGITGDQGLLGDQGTQGDNGEDGYQGSTGAQGITGASGLLGSTGASGAQGIDGASGPQGATGSQGTDGASGPQGVTGQAGHDGATGFSLASGSTGLSGTSQQTVDIFASNMVGTAKYLVQGVDGSTNVQATEVIFTHNAGAVYLTEYATLRTGSKVMDVTAALSGGVVSLKVTPTSSPTTVSWVREDVQGRIGGTTVTDDGSNLFSSRTHADSIGIPLGKAYVYVPAYFSNLIDFSTLVTTNASITFDAAGVGPQNPAVGTIDSWDGAVAVMTIVSGNFQSRDDLDKITYGY